MRASITIIFLILLAALGSGAELPDGAALLDASFIDDAATANELGIDLANEGRIRDSVAYFERAVELDKESADYLNNLGVSLMRLRRFDNARVHFQLALRLDPRNGDAKSNLRELERFEKQLSQNSPPSATSAGHSFDESAVSKKTDHPRMKLPRVHIKNFWLPENKKFHDGDLPFLLEGAIDNWAAMTQWTTEWLSTQFPDAIVDFYPHNMAQSDRKPYLTKMPKALKELYRPSGEYPSDPAAPGVYLQWNIALKDWHTLLDGMDLPYTFNRDFTWLDDPDDSCFSNDDVRDEFSKKTHWRMMLIGNKGAGMFGHIDVLRTASWQAQLKGAKKWFICAPSERPHLGQAGEVDAWNWDPEKHPWFANARCYDDVVHAGEMIYYPREYWHQTFNLATPSMSISSTILDQNNYQFITEELKNECYRKKFKWNFSEQLCSDLERCFTKWEHRYGTLERPTCSLSEAPAL